MLPLPKWLIAGLTTAGLCVLMLAAASRHQWLGIYGLVIAFVIAKSIQNDRHEAYGRWPARTALILTFVAYFLAKAGGAHLAAEDFRMTMIANSLTNQDAILMQAELIAANRQAAGKSVHWPPRRTNDGIRQTHDYPQDILDEAAAWWEQLSVPNRLRILSDLQNSRGQIVEQRVPRAILEYTFQPNNPSEFYFLGVSLLIAYRLAFRSKPDDPPQAEVASATPQ